MPTRRRLLSLALLLFTLPAYALQLAGVDVDDNLDVDGTLLSRNGAGVRRFLFFKVYVAALYLAQPARQPRQAIDAAGPKCLRLVMLRDVGASELAEKMQSGIDHNVAAGQLHALQPALTRLRQTLLALGELRSGQVLDLLWLPGQGTVLRVDAHAIGAPEPDPGLYPALLRVWLGERPVDAGLKAALLGS